MSAKTFKSFQNKNNILQHMKNCSSSQNTVKDKVIKANENVYEQLKMDMF
jgi:hypothetical protein